jgi:hypothetical protein
MEIDEVRQRFRELVERQRIRVLAAFGHNLTIVARDTYVVGELAIHAPERLRAINEIQHRVLAHILALATEDTRRYPDDVLLSILLDHDDEQLRTGTLWALEHAINRHGA